MIFTRLSTSVGVVTIPGHNTDHTIKTMTSLGIKVHSIQTVIITNRNAG